ncbi:MAG: site-specific DNA-methyltransferase [Anaerolineae bacterium]|nr:site-specific DNA-methyltransferase [Anaerolineae bacterium]
MAELTWRGKYDTSGQRIRQICPGQTLQTVATVGMSQTDCPNRLIEGEAQAILPALLPDFAGQVNLIYLDPPFASGNRFRMGHASGQQAALAYDDSWDDEDHYLQWLSEILMLARDLLHETGSIYVHLAHHIGHYARLVLDEIFGRDCFQNEVIWFYRTGGASPRRYARKHDNLFFYSRSPERWTFHPHKERSYMKHHYGYRKSHFEVDEVTGQQYSLVYPRDVWEIPAVGSASAERVGYPTQKPEALLDRIIRTSSNPGDLVLDCFAGSGTTAVIAEKLERRWIAADASSFAIQTTQKRLMTAGAAFWVQAASFLPNADSVG